MAKRAFDMLASAVLLIALSPLLLVAALGVALSSRGPVLYRAQRVGRGGAPFTMHKFRTMHVTSPGARGSVITGARDPRVFAVGRLLRTTKVDELPQLWDVLRGAMTLVGPRPEDPAIVERHYTVDYRATLAVRPGLASPGSIFNYTHGDALLSGEDPETAYVERLLPLKMAIERAYLARASFGYDLAVIARTGAVIAAVAAGRRQFPLPPELEWARQAGWIESETIAAVTAGRECRA